MRVSLVAAVAANGVIGNRGRLPWGFLKEDMEHFRQLTLGKPVIMGRKTFESIPGGALPGRLNLVLSGGLPLPTEPCRYEVCRDLRQALGRASRHSDGAEAFVIGGAAVYAEALTLPETTRLYLTRIGQAYPGDTSFPRFDTKSWLKAGVRKVGSLTFEEWHRIQPNPEENSID